MRFALLVLGMVLGFAAHAENDHRAEFKAALSTVAKASQSAPMACVESASGHPSTKVNYTITLEDLTQFKDAYLVHFKSIDGAHEWSTMIAYEGDNGYIMGALVTSQQGPMVRYQHMFRGMLDDQMNLSLNNGKATELLFRKSSGSTIIQYVNCLL